MANNGIQQVFQEIEKNKKLSKVTEELLGRVQGIPYRMQEEGGFDGILKCKVSIANNHTVLSVASKHKSDNTCIINVMRASGLDHLTRSSCENDEIALYENTNLSPVFLSEQAKVFLFRPLRFDGWYGSPCALYTSGVTIFRHNGKTRRDRNWEQVNVLSAMLPSFYRKSYMFEQASGCSTAYQLVQKKLRYIINAAIGLGQTKLIFGDFNSKALRIPDNILVPALYNAIGAVSDKLDEVVFSTWHSGNFASRLQKTFL